MKGKLLRFAWNVALLAMLASITAGAVTHEYEVIEIGPGRAHAINDAGRVVGRTAGDHAFAWDENRGTVDLHELFGLTAPNSSGVDISNRGAILVGTQGPDSYIVSLTPGGRSFTALPDYLIPVAINEPGTVLGGEMPAVLWTSRSGIQAFTNLANADDINNRGQVLGTASAAWDPTLPPGINVVVAYRSGDLTSLGAYAASPGYPATVVRPGAITDSGVVVYSVAVYEGPGYPTELTGFRWHPASGHSEFPGLWLTAVSNSGLMAGTTSVQRPVMVDGNDLVTYLPMPDGYQYAFVEDINSHGAIAGSVTGSGVPQLAVVWKPKR